jgi:hypothetical protein
MHRFRRFLFRERRRVGLFMLLVTLAAFLLYTDDIGVEFGVRHAAVAAIGTGLGAGLIALGILMIAPSWRQAMETVAISTFLYAVAIVRIPGVSFHNDGHSLVAFVGFLVAAALVHLAIYGSWSDPWLRLPRAVERTTALTRLDRATVWAAAVPAPETIGDYWDDSVVAITADAEDADRMVLFHRFPDGTMLEQEVRFDQIAYLKSFRYFYRRLNAAPRGRQSLALVIEQRGADLALHLRWERCRYPLRLALMRRIDDWGGRSADRLLGRLEAAVAEVGTGAALPA